MQCWAAMLAYCSLSKKRSASADAPTGRFPYVTAARPALIEGGLRPGSHPGIAISRSRGRRRAAPFPVALAIIAAACGALSAIRQDLGGELFLGELALIPVGLLSLIAWRGRRLLADPLFYGLIAAGLLTFAGYVLSDLAAGTPEQQYVRGWARVAFTLADAVFLGLLAVNDARVLLAFALGYGLGTAGVSAGSGFGLLTEWKIGYGQGLSLAFLALVGILPHRARAFAVLAFGAASVLLDYRSLGGVMIAIGAVLLVRAARPDAPLLVRRSFVSIAVVGAIAIAVLIAAVGATRDEYGARWASSNAGRTLDLVVGLPAIWASPLVGYGSWAFSRELGSEARSALAERLTTESGRRTADAVRTYFPHSQLIQSWYEGGILGISFFVVYLAVIAGTLSRVARVRPLDAASPLLLYVLTIGLWNVFMSPWGGNHRLAIALAIGAVFVVRAERRLARRGDRPR